MAFGKITKEDLIAAGLDPDKLAEFQANGVTKTMLDAMKTELTASLTTSITDQLKAGFTELESKLRPTPIVKNDGEEDEQPTDHEQFINDPTGFVTKKVDKLGHAAAIEFKKMARNLAYKNGQSLKGFSNPALKAEIDEEWKKYTPEMLARNNGDPEQLLQQIHDMVLGRHHDEIVQDANKKDGKFNLVHSGSGRGDVINDTNTNIDKTKVLTDTEKTMAKKFGMTDAEWLAEGDAMVQEENTRHKVGV
jgi:hypothetical protein